MICREQLQCELLAAFIEGIIAYARQNNYLDESIIQDYRAQLNRLVQDPASTSRRFLEFLDGSLARVRLHLARRLLERLATSLEPAAGAERSPDSPSSLLKEYVQRIEWLIQGLESGEIDGRLLDLSVYFGEQAGLIDLAKARPRSISRDGPW